MISLAICLFVLRQGSTSMADPRMSHDDKYQGLLQAEDAEKLPKPPVDDGKGSVLATSVLLCSSGMGSGMFVLPYAIAQAGPVSRRHDVKPASHASAA